ncbi:MAG: HlyD family type I secretion periplasmic adaptor subunit, partial [Gammaproteobacteria bacterium]|nr:HlyD family type I secretion periplasmic adaptor subunit [Gammaproteobacteria bacterium]
MATSSRGGYSEADIAYMQSLQGAVVQRSPKHLIVTVVVMAGALLALLIWMSWAEIDSVVRGSGRIIPSSQLQRVQSLEGGVISEIFVSEGDDVVLDQPLVKISDVAAAGSFE